MKKMSLTLSASVFFLAGCLNSEPVTLSEAELPDIELEEVCELYEQPCKMLQADSRCRRERANALIGHYNYYQAPSPAKAYRQIIRLEQLLSCAELSQLIEYIPVDQKYPKPESTMTDEEIKAKRRYAKSVQKIKNDKLQNFRYTKYMMGGLINSNRESNDPYMLYYFWSKGKDKEAFTKLEKLYNEGKITQHDIKYFLAQGFIKFDEEKALDLMYESLEAYPPALYTDKTDFEAEEKGNLRISDKGRVHFAIFRSLTDMYYKKGEYDKSYIFACLLKLNNDMTANAEMILQKFDEKHFDVDKLEDIADEIDDMLDDGKFTQRVISKV